MAHVSQADFTRAVRGGAVTIGVAPPVSPLVPVLGSIARASVRMVHNESPDEAMTYFDETAAKYLNAPGAVGATAHRFRDALERYVEWDGTGATADFDVTGEIPFGVGNSVRALAHVCVDDGSGKAHAARVLLWDDLPSSNADAEFIALPVLKCAEAHLGTGSVSRVEVWQLETGQREVVLPATAQARWRDVQRVLSKIH
jgi:hypothetical protein